MSKRFETAEEVRRYMEECRQRGLEFRVVGDGSLYAGPPQKIGHDDRKVIRKNVAAILAEIKSQMAPFEAALENDVYCPECLEAFNMESLKAAMATTPCCPKCQSRASPLRYKYDVDVKVNWHQMRLIGLVLSKVMVGIPEPAASDIRVLIRKLEKSNPKFAEEFPISADGLVSKLYKAHGLDQ